MVRWILLCALLAFPAAAEVVQGRARAIDGDTLAIGALRVRLYGIDAPETGQRCKTAEGKPWPCGAAATKRLAVLISGGDLRCEGRGYDRYDRLLAVCRIGGKDVNATLVAEGLAEAYRKYALDYVPQEQAARAARRGLWQGAHEAPQAVRAATKSAPAPQSAPGGCAIKGNISGNGRIYHLPGSRSYEKTRIDTAKGERWFCSEGEARAAGWRAARG
jgi:endonuclease YncB( thermonuclease family)